MHRRTARPKGVEPDVSIEASTRHEVRNIITVIEGECQLLALRLRNHTEVHHNLATLQAMSHRLIRLCESDLPLGT